MTTQEQVDHFHQFATEQLANGGSELTVDELYDRWRFENQTPDEYADNVAAIQASIDDMRNGVRGRDAGEVIRELRSELNIPAGE